MNREQRAEAAKETLQIFKQGYYFLNGHKIDISHLHQQTLAHSQLYSPPALTQLRLPAATYYDCHYSVINQNVVTLIHQLYQKSKDKIGVLNFASAKNPGGGFLNGSLAQEESLALCSNLYLSQIENRTYYEVNRQPDVDACYSDYMIYSDKVVFIRDNALFTPPALACVVTAPAVNMGAYLSQGGDRQLANQRMKTRMRYLLKLFATKQIDTLILGAYGCGVFRNDPFEVASFFFELLKHENLGHYFKYIVFAIYDHSRQQEVITPFNKLFTV